VFSPLTLPQNKQDGYQPKYYNTKDNKEKAQSTEITAVLPKNPGNAAEYKG
jgi:hypothetical protein